MAGPRKRKSAVLDSVRASLTQTERKQIDSKLAISARIGDAIAEKFESKGHFAEAVGVSQGLVSRWLSGSHNFTMDTLVQIEETLGIRLLNRGEYAFYKAEMYPLSLSKESEGVYVSTPKYHEEQVMGSLGVDQELYVRAGALKWK